jgi:ABC-type nitrate/sulfonate/bicarbonate transport system ATPase subunit
MMSSVFELTGEIEAFKDISLKVAPEEFVVIIGRAGCGTSTLLSLISGILDPIGGVVLLDGKESRGPGRDAPSSLVRAQRRLIQRLFQRPLAGAPVGFCPWPEAEAVC